MYKYTKFWGDCETVFSKIVGALPQGVTEVYHVVVELLPCGLILLHAFVYLSARFLHLTDFISVRRSSSS